MIQYIIYWHWRGDFNTGRWKVVRALMFCTLKLNESKYTASILKTKTSVFNMQQGFVKFKFVLKH